MREKCVGNAWELVNPNVHVVAPLARLDDAVTAARASGAPGRVVRGVGVVKAYMNWSYYRIVSANSAPNRALQRKSDFIWDEVDVEANVQPERAGSASAASIAAIDSAAQLPPACMKGEPESVHGVGLQALGHAGLC